MKGKTLRVVTSFFSDSGRIKIKIKIREATLLRLLTRNHPIRIFDKSFIYELSSTLQFSLLLSSLFKHTLTSIFFFSRFNNQNFFSTGHPSVKVFITQGGLQSFQEAVHHAVPMVGIPLFSDQRCNVAKIVDAKIGVRLSPEELHSFEKIKSAIDKVLYDKRLVYEFLTQRSERSLKKVKTIDGLVCLLGRL